MVFKKIFSWGSLYRTKVFYVLFAHSQMCGQASYSLLLLPQKLALKSAFVYGFATALRASNFFVAFTVFMMIWFCKIVFTVQWACRAAIIKRKEVQKSGKLSCYCCCSNSLLHAPHLKLEKLGLSTALSKTYTKVRYRSRTAHFLKFLKQIKKVS